jgi:uncharacterized membrane protein
MNRRHRLLLFPAFSTAIFLFLLILALFMTILWMKTLLAFVLASGIAIPIYWKHRFNHAEKVEKQLMISQKKRFTATIMIGGTLQPTQQN